ncbi:AbrB/MazE/SpoVT family DNA-binding domain-containing protein [Candidatus Micrarchaeota archaeon]|nr:AbrB/MazE/SpoVT family DNA-binding domain-containing protein [Candidatus Micrarchaeota archaeon]
MTKKCPACNTGRLGKTDNIVSEIGGYVFVEKGERCSNCGQEFPFEKESQRTIELARRLGVWPEPLTLYRTLSEVGNSLVFRIPSDLERQLKLKAGDEVKVTKLGHKIVIEPV